MILHCGNYKSWLFMPINEPRFTNKINEINSDLFVLDLEDSVLKSEKKNARRLIHKVLLKNNKKKESILIRVNNINTPYFEDDIKECISADVHNIVYPKLESSIEISLVKEFIEKFNTNISVIPIIETVKGLENVERILKSKYINIVIFGSEDYLADLGVKHRGTISNNPFLMDAIVKIAYYSSLYNKVFIDCVTPYYYSKTDLQLLEKECLFSLQIGASGKLAIHPNQLSTINQIFERDKNDSFYLHDKIITIVKKMKKERKGVVSYNNHLVGIPEIKKLFKLLVRTSDKEKISEIKLFLKKNIDI